MESGVEEKAGPSKSMIVCHIDTDKKCDNKKKLTKPIKGRNVRPAIINNCEVAETGVDEAMNVDVIVNDGDGGIAAKNARPREEMVVHESKKRRVNDSLVRYSNNHKGEPHVLVDTSEVDNGTNKKVKNGLYFVQKIRDIKSDEFDKIKKIDAIGVTLYKLTFEDVESANKFLDNEELRKRKLRAFVPRNFVETFGVIRNVPLCYSEQEILENATSSINITSVKRFTRRDEKEVGVFHPTETVKIGFAGDDHPSWIVFEKSVLVVSTYYPAIRQCYNCGRLGHTKLGCRSKKRCIKCGADSEVCNGQCGGKKCILCKAEGHLASDKEICPSWIKEIETNKIMTRKKMSKREVLQKYNNQNRFDLLADDDSFPELSNGRNRKKTAPVREDMRDRDVNQILTPYTYSSVAKRQRKEYVHRTGVQTHPRMFPETQPSSPVYMTSELRVSELEKVTSEMLAFMMDFFKMSGNTVAIDAANHFNSRLVKCGLVPQSSNSSLLSNSSFYGKDTTV